MPIKRITLLTTGNWNPKTCIGPDPMNPSTEMARMNNGSARTTSTMRIMDSSSHVVGK